MAETKHTGRGGPPRDIPADLSAGLDLVAATWLEQWADAGGWASLSPDGKLALGFPDECFPPETVRPAARLPAQVQERHDAFCDGRHHGTRLALEALLRRIPHGMDALAEHMRAHGLRAYSAKVRGDRP